MIINTIFQNVEHVLEIYYLPYNIISVNKNEYIIIIPEFDIEEFVQSLGSQVTDVLVPGVASQVLGHFDITKYLRSPSCQRTDSMFQPNTGGFKLGMLCFMYYMLYKLERDSKLVSTI